MLSPISQSANKLTPLMLPLSAIVFSNPIDDLVSELVRRLRIVTECILQQIAEDTRRCIQTPLLYANLIVNYIFRDNTQQDRYLHFRDIERESNSELLFKWHILCLGVEAFENGQQQVDSVLLPQFDQFKSRCC